MKNIFVNATYPKNFILLGMQIDELRCKAEVIVSEAFERFEEIFNGEVASFPFDLRYVPPFDKSFPELMRLQGVAAENVRFKDSYRGYIILDVSEFLKHEKEPYFQRTIRFLHDENDGWRYIFIIDKTNEKAARDMSQAILEFIKYTKVIDDEDISDNNHRFLKDICQRKNMKLDVECFEFMESLLTKERINRNVVETIMCDLSAICGNSTVSSLKLREYLESDNTIARYMMSETTFDRVLMACRDLKKKGREHE